MIVSRKVLCEATAAWFLWLLLHDVIDLELRLFGQLETSANQLPAGDSCKNECNRISISSTFMLIGFCFIGKRADTELHPSASVNELGTTCGNIIAYKSYLDRISFSEYDLVGRVLKYDSIN